MRHLQTMTAAVALLGSMAMAGAAQALVVTTTNDVTTLTNALVAPGSGITVNTASLTSYSAFQQGTFTGFNLAPSSGSTPTLNMPNGVVLTTGTANVAATNTANQGSSIALGGAGYAPLSTLAGINTNDANLLTYSFSLAAGLNAVQAQFVFATEEFPTQQ